MQARLGDGAGLPAELAVIDDRYPGARSPANVPWSAEALRRALNGAPGPELARAVADVTRSDADLLAALPDEALADLVVACGRLQSWAAGLQARAVGERAGREDSPLAHSSLVAQVTGELVVTSSEASEVVVRGESGVDHPSVLTALTDGRIDVKKAHTLLRSASRLTTAERAEAIARYLPLAPVRTWRWLQSKMLAFATSRHGAAQAAKAAAERRSLQLDRADNGMAWLTAYLPAVDAAGVWGVVDDMAHQLRRTSGEERDLGQLRADCLTGIVTGQLLPAERFAEQVADGDTTGSDTAGSDSAGRDATDSDSAGSDATVGGAEPGVTRTAAGDRHVCTCGGRAPVRRDVLRVVPTRPVVRVTVPASVLLGLDDAPGELDGFGPVPADLAARIAADATWQRLVTDPVTGVLTDYSTTSYRPGVVLRQAVVARDRTCGFPACEHPAERADLDHIVPFDHELDPRTLPGRPGQTRAANLQPLCRRHHLLKTHGRWDVVRDPVTGTTTWTAPTGRVHQRPPTVLDTHVEIDQVDPDTSYDLTLRALGSCRGTRPDAAADLMADNGVPRSGDAAPRSSDPASRSDDRAAQTGDAGPQAGDGCPEPEDPDDPGPLPPF